MRGRGNYRNVHGFMRLDDTRAENEDGRKDADAVRPHHAVGDSVAIALRERSLDGQPPYPGSLGKSPPGRSRHGAARNNMPYGGPTVCIEVTDES